MLSLWRRRTKTNMGLISLLVVAAMPIVQFLLIGLLGAFLASGYSNILSASTRENINNIAFVVFTPAIVYASLAKAVTLRDLISWWYLPVNVAMTFLIGGVLGWLVVKILKPELHLKGLIISFCCSGNFGNLPLIIIPALCDKSGSPFGEAEICRSRGLSYVSLSMSIGGIFLYTITYSLMRKFGGLCKKNQTEGLSSEINNQEVIIQPSIELRQNVEKIIPLLSTAKLSGNIVNFRDKLKNVLHQILELMTPPTIATIVGLVVGLLPWLKSLLIGPTAPLRVIQNSITTLGDGLIPCVILILGGNLIQGLRKASLKPSVIVTIIVVRYVLLPIVGLALVKATDELGFLPRDPLYHYVLMLHFALPPAMSIGTISQLFDIATEECSVIFFWTYIAAAFALTAWSTVFMWLLS